MYVKLYWLLLYDYKSRLQWEIQFSNLNLKVILEEENSNDLAHTALQYFV